MFDLTTTSIDIASHADTLASDSCGAVVTFEGRVRNHHDERGVEKLIYEVYPEMAMRQGQGIIDEALSRFDITHATCIHRHGELQVGELAVWIGIASAHRAAAFAACAWCIDTIKERLPMWKKEFYTDGTEPRWVACHHAPAGSHATH